MKRYLTILRAHIHFLIYVLGCDVFFAFLLWVTDSSAFGKVSLLIALFSVLTFLLVCALLAMREGRIERAFSDYLESPDDTHTRLLISHLPKNTKKRAEVLCGLLDEKEKQRADLLTQNEDYEEYVEAWAHEAKTPIALLSLLLDNNREVMDPETVYKLEYIRSRLSGSVDQMLQYARLKGGRKDYLFENLDIREILDEVVEEYRPLLLEKNFTVVNDVVSERIYADKRALLYMLGQFVSNSIKYSSGDSPRLSFRIEKPDKLVISDNGIGVKKSDLPYIFERGFTGNTGSARKKATGMGLYLASRIADDMNFKLNVASEAGKGFEIVVQYPIVES
ncbi:MAG: sensor histidine kinase [Clostridiales bacterium]|nr:sensor histidine kinase [Clostridiales bacterium]